MNAYERLTGKNTEHAKDNASLTRFKEENDVDA